LVDAQLKGTINLGNLSQAYPIKLDKPLSGILVADVTTKIRHAIGRKFKYENINNAGLCVYLTLNIPTKTENHLPFLLHGREARFGFWVLRWDTVDNFNKLKATTSTCLESNKTQHKLKLY
jgi:hypothetical protein